MTDVFNVTATWDKTSYNSGDTMKATISGSDVVTTQFDYAAGPITVPIINLSNNASTTFVVPSIMIHAISVSTMSVVIDTTKPIVDNSTAPRTWTVSNDLLSITATA